MYIYLRYFGLVLVSRSHNQNFNGKKLFLGYFGAVFTIIYYFSVWHFQSNLPSGHRRL